jgi:hypothetical protein
MIALEMKSKFNNIISDRTNKKRSDSNLFLTIEDNNIRIEQLKHLKFVSKTSGEKKSMKDYRIYYGYTRLLKMSL